MENNFMPTPSFIAQAQLILKSFHHWTGRHLIPPQASSSADAQALFQAPIVVVSHGTEADPILNFGNQAALKLWEMTWEELTQTPSRLTAEPMNREERARLLAQVTEKGFIENYQGIRISKSGRRFRIEQAIVWNLIDEQGNYAGQAAMFENWRYL